MSIFWPTVFQHFYLIYLYYNYAVWHFFHRHKAHWYSWKTSLLHIASSFCHVCHAYLVFHHGPVGAHVDPSCFFLILFFNVFLEKGARQLFCQLLYSSLLEDEGRRPGFAVPDARRVHHLPSSHRGTISCSR
jgi:hypothetical protein